MLGEGLLGMANAVHRVLVADLVAPSAVRRFFRYWLAELRWPSDESDDLLLAVSEAVSNVVEHAYPQGLPGEVVVEAHCELGTDGGRYVVVLVSDHGAWRPQPVWHENRRRGLQLMRACTGSVQLEGTAHGTRIWLTSRPVPVEPKETELAQS
jgi:anti-sigma regulatory factor (Ser/Thr protein kinase)